MINTGRLWVALGLIFAAGVSFSPSARADENAQQNLASDDEKSPKVPLEKKEEAAESQNWLFHLQGTEILQGQPGFHAPYSGINSLHPGDNFRQTTTADLYFGARLLPGIEVYFNPEYYQGFSFGRSKSMVASSSLQRSKIFPASRLPLGECPLLTSSTTTPTPMTRALSF